MFIIILASQFLPSFVIKTKKTNRENFNIFSNEN